VHKGVALYDAAGPSWNESKFEKTS